MDIQEHFNNLIQEEERKHLEAIENGEEYKMKSFEILEGEIREVTDDEGILIRENPLNFPASVQRKYFWVSAEDWTFPESVDPESGIPENCIIQSKDVENPYTKEVKTIDFYQYVPPAPKPTNQEIWENITQEVYDGNPYAQIADLAKAQVTTLALLVPILGKETINTAYADLIATVKKVSESRVKQGLSAYDLSFLD